MADGTAVSVAAWNVQVFGRSKMAKEGVAEMLADVILNYDVVCVQEVRDATERAIEELHSVVNERARGNDDEYGLLLSERLGRTSSKEQYAWFYRKEKVSVVRESTYADKDDNFERSPQTVWWNVHGAGEFGFMCMHVSPEDAVEELDAMADVADEQINSGSSHGLLIGGDLNADCSYVTNSEEKCARDESCMDIEIDLFKSDYTWHISDDEDTTTKASNCAYDRFITRGEIHVYDAEVVRFDTELHLSPEQAQEVSDHYPIASRVMVSPTSEEGQTSSANQRRRPFFESIFPAMILLLNIACLSWGSKLWMAFSPSESVPAVL